MNTMQRGTLMLALAGALSMPTALMAADATQDAPASYEPARAEATYEPDKAEATSAGPMAPSPETMRAMRERMWEMHKTTDPEKRKELMDAQMKDMDAMMGERPCAMADELGGMVVMGRGGMMGQGMPGGMMGQGMSGGMGMGMPVQHDMMEKRMDMLEKRMDMMLMMMRMQMDKSGR